MPTLFINKERVDVAASVPGDTPLLWILRDYLSMTGTKYGCGIARVRRVHGLDRRPAGARLRDAAVLAQAGGGDHHDRGCEDRRRPPRSRPRGRSSTCPQCGYCQSGQVMAAAALLAKKKRPTDADIDEAMTGILCRCATYPRIRAAIKEAAKALG